MLQSTTWRFPLRVPVRLLLALLTAGAISLLFMVVLPSTFGQFDASTKNPGNSVAAGTLTMSNSQADAAIFSSSNQKPGDVTTGSVTITNSGTLPATMTLAESNVTHDGPAGSSDLSAQLDLVITDGATTVYSGKLNALSTTTLPPASGTQWAAGESHTYDFTVTFPLSSDNSYQGTSTSVEFDWTGVQ